MPCGPLSVATAETGILLQYLWRFDPGIYVQSKSSTELDSQASAPAVIESNEIVEKRLPKVQTSRSGLYKSLDQGAVL